MKDLHVGILHEFAEAQALGIALIENRHHAARARRLQDGRDYYRFVRTQPHVREKENAAQRAKRIQARLTRAEARPPCPQCGAQVTRGAIVPRGRKLPKYCSAKCMRAARWKRWYAKQKAAHELRGESC